ncbi:MAG: multidrug efflux pump subunit AcrB [Flavobacterium sp.]|jgi:multidrug efflux pump subunit AcrB
MDIDQRQSGVIAWFVRNPVAANLLMFLILILGFISAFSIRTQAMPDAQLELVVIEAIYPGAAPTEIESAIITKIEDALNDVQGIAEIEAVAKEGFAQLSLEVSSDFDVETILDEAKLAVDRVSGFPDNMEKLRIYKRDIKSLVMFVQVYGELDERGLKEFAYTIREELKALPSVSSVDFFGARNYEISIELGKAQLRQYDLTLNEVADAIRKSSLDLPAGTLKTKSGNILLRTEGQAYTQSDFENITLRTNEDGTRLRLVDIATITDGFEEVEGYLLFDNATSVGMQVFAVGNQNALNIAEEIKNYVAERRLTLPDKVSIDSWLDLSFYLETVVEMMLDNLWYGVLLVYIVLGLFLRLQLAFWVIVGLPVCFLGAIALMPAGDISINIMSLFGFILVLGIVVDDAIIIGESAQSAVEEFGLTQENVIKGVYKVAMPATFGVLTTIAAFTPMVLMEGPIAGIAGSIGGVVICCLIFSLVESKLILPSHLAQMAPLEDIPEIKMAYIRRKQHRFATGFKIFVSDYYKPFLIYAVRHRYNTVAVFIAMLIIAAGIIASPLVHVVLFPQLPQDFIQANVEVVDGAPPSQTIKIVKQVAAAIREINSEQPEGEQFITHLFEQASGSSGFIFVELAKNKENEVNAIELADKWRKKIGDIAGTKKLETNGSTGVGGGTTFNFKLMSNNYDQLDQAASQLEEVLATYEGVYDIQSTNNSSAQEVNLQIKPSAENLGISLQDLAQQVRAAFYGVEAQRIQRDLEEVRVMVRYDKAERVSMGNLENMYIRTSAGKDVPFQAVADLDLRYGYSSINRNNGKRAVIITANGDISQLEPGQVVRSVQEKFSSVLAGRYPDVKLELGGASQEEQKFLRNLIFMMLLTLFVIYALMAIPLKSYLQPLIIMAVIPFGLVGALIGHILLGMSFSFLSVFGIVALAGVVVNDSLILVDFVNKGVDQGMDLETAAVDAGTRRIRAILLTSLTTFFGLLPMLTETSLSAQLVLPMAVSLGFGILFATGITLILIPCLYVIMVDVDRSRNVFAEHTYEQLLKAKKDKET